MSGQSSVVGQCPNTRCQRSRMGFGWRGSTTDDPEPGIVVTRVGSGTPRRIDCHWHGTCFLFRQCETLETHATSLVGRSQERGPRGKTRRRCAQPVVSAELDELAAQRRCSIDRAMLLALTGLVCQGTAGWLCRLDRRRCLLRPGAQVRSEGARQPPCSMSEGGVRL
jgi:hypothetical protein